MGDEKYHEVIELCNEALKINKEFSGAYHMRASANYSLKNYNEAYNDQSKVIDIEPNISAITA